MKNLLAPVAVLSLVALSSFAFGCSLHRDAATPPAGAPAEVRALDFLVGDHASANGNGTLRCAFSPSGAGVDCVETIARDDGREVDRLAITWSATTHDYHFELLGGGGVHLVGNGTKTGARLVLVSEGPTSRRFTFEAGEGGEGDETLHVVSETCVQSTCQATVDLRMEVPFVAPVDGRNG